MAIIATKTSFAEAPLRGTHGSYVYITQALGTGSGTFNVQVPVGGKVAGAFVSAGATALDATNKYTLTLINKTAADASVVASVTPVAAAYAKATDLTVVSAGASVSRGDTLQVGSTVAGTITGGGFITIVLETNAA